MPPRRKAGAAAAASAELNGSKSEADSGDLNAMREEVAAEGAPTPAPDDDTWPRPIAFGDVTVRVKHWLDWDLDSDKHLVSVDISSWAEGVLADDENGNDFKDIWVPTKKTLRQGLAFVRAVEVATGIPFAPHLALLTT